MTQSIPNSFSRDDLEKMLETAMPDFKPEAKQQGEATKDELLDLADRLLSEAVEEINDPMIHKAMMVCILNNFIRWHNHMAEKAIETEQDTGTIACWYRDAGKFQAISNILYTINCGENDFFVNED